MEHAIGTKITLEVVANENGCMGCFFRPFCNGEPVHIDSDDDFTPDLILCGRFNRADGIDIIYKEIKEDTK